MLSIISLSFRALQILIAVVVVGISATFMNDQHLGDSPATTRFSVLVGVYGMLAGAVGIVCLFVDRVPTFVQMVGDGLGALFFVAGGIAWAVGMQGQSCTVSKIDKLYHNPLLNQGCRSNGYCLVQGQSADIDGIWPNPLQGLCQKAFANEGFQLAGFVAFVILVALGFLQAKRKGPKPNYVS